MRFFLSLVLALAAVGLGSPAKADLEIRFSGGLSATRIDYRPHPQWFKSRVSGEVGGYASVRLVGPAKGAVRLESGFDIGTRGGSLRLQHYERFADRVHIEWQETSLTIPVMIRIQPPDVDQYFKLGVGFDRLGIDRTVEGAFNRFDLAEPRSYDALLMAGAGTDSELFGVRFFVEAEASIGLLNVESEDSQSSLHNRTLRIGFGLILDTSQFAPPGDDESDE